MAVPKGPFVFCEGVLDEILLQRVIVGSSTITVKPIGSKDGFTHRIEGYLSGTGKTDTSQTTYIALRDRDFDHHDIPSKCQLIERDKKGKPVNQWVFLTYRACIESYLIDAELIHRYWDHLHSGPKNPLPEPLRPEAIENKIVEAAQSIADYQAVRWGVSSFIPQQPPYSPRLRVSEKKDGDLPAQLSFDACLKEAERVFQQAYLDHPTSCLQWDMIVPHILEYRDRFNQENFYKNQEHLIWFHGKDLMTAVFKILNVPGLGRKSYAEWAVVNVDFERYDDLRELDQRCRALI